MSNLKEIRNRISSVSTTQQITSAMKMVAAAKLKKAQDSILQLRPYDQKLNDILMDILDYLKDEKSNAYTRIMPVRKTLIVVIASNRGLCGAFNTNIIRKATNIAREEYSSQLRMGTLDFYIIGKKGGEAIKRAGFNIADSRNEIFDDLNYDNAASIAEELMEQFISEKYDRIDIIYNQFINAAVQELRVEQFLPVKLVKQEDPELEMKKKYETFSDFIFEPSQDYIVDELIPRSLKTHFFKALLDSFASEQGARMTAMHKATDNAADLIRDLSLEYNKARQAAITKEILEISGGAEALNYR